LWAFCATWSQQTFCSPGTSEMFGAGPGVKRFCAMSLGSRVRGSRCIRSRQSALLPSPVSGSLVLFSTKKFQSTDSPITGGPTAWRQIADPRQRSSQLTGVPARSGRSIGSKRHIAKIRSSRLFHEVPQEMPRAHSQKRKNFEAKVQTLTTGHAGGWGKIDSGR
jgi:hypothetical protein